MTGQPFEIWYDIGDTEKLTPLEDMVLRAICSEQFAELLPEIPKLNVKLRQYTVHGWYIHFYLVEGLDRYKKSGFGLTGIITHDRLDYGASATMNLEPGGIDCLEMYSFGDNPFPEAANGFGIT